MVQAATVDRENKHNETQINDPGLGLALYKCQSMGLLPTHSSDWLAFIDPQQRIEYSGGGQILL